MFHKIYVEYKIQKVNAFKQYYNMPDEDNILNDQFQNDYEIGSSQENLILKTKSIDEMR